MAWISVIFEVFIHCLHTALALTVCWETLALPAVILSSKLNHTFLEYFTPINVICIIVKINSFWGDLTDVSAVYRKLSARAQGQTPVNTKRPVSHLGHPEKKEKIMINKRF